jgi:hypothetical protein
VKDSPPALDSEAWEWWNRRKLPEIEAASNGILVDGSGLSSPCHIAAALKAGVMVSDPLTGQPQHKRIFVSHVSEEEPLAGVLKEWIGKAVGADRVFASSFDIHLGDQWLDQINTALSDSSALIALCSPRSLQRPWVNFEAGGAWGTGRPVLPVCHSGMTREQLPNPLAIFQAVDLDDASACAELVRRSAALLGVPEAGTLDYEEMLQAVEEALDRIARSNPFGVPPLPSPAAGRAGILVDLSHRQSEWPQDDAPSFFDRDQRRLRSPVSPDRQPAWELGFLDDARHLWSADLASWHGLILALPHEALISNQAREQLVAWVAGGGRLLLLGYELGDHHHEGNLNALAHEFGIHFEANIVAPPGYPDRKPYGVPIDLAAESVDHPVLRGVRRLRLVNLQTISPEPGALEFVRLGTNEIYRPARDAVLYDRGSMRVPSGRFDRVGPAPTAQWPPKPPMV